ncbi:MAG: hypothetical protein Q9226_008204 [Calogaya cf. arnoldii]
MADDSYATAQAVINQNSPSVSKDMTEGSISPKLDSSLFDHRDRVMTTDGGNDTEPEGEIHDNVGHEEQPKKGDKSSPKKRGASNTGEDNTSPKKKRAPAKSKTTAKASDGASETISTDKKKPSTPGRPAKFGDAKDSENAATESNGSGTDRPSTPEAQDVQEPKTPKTPGSPIDDNVVEANNTTPRPARAKSHPAKPKVTAKHSPVKGKRAGAEKVAEKVVLPTKWSEASTADKTLVSMKEAGKPWSEIRVKWFEMTGQDTASSTLPNRYKRLQTIMMELQDGEKETLLAAKEAVEANWKNALWGLVASKMEEMGGRKYPADFLFKEFKKLETAGTTAAHSNGAYAPTTPVASKANGSTPTAEDIKSEEDEVAAGGDILLAAATEAMAGESEAADEENAE